MIVDGIKRWNRRRNRFYGQRTPERWTAEEEHAAIGKPDFSALWPELEAIAPRDAWTVHIAFDVGAVIFAAQVGEQNVEVLHDGTGHLVTVVPAGVRVRDHLRTPNGGGFGDANSTDDETIADTLARAIEAAGQPREGAA